MKDRGRWLFLTIGLLFGGLLAGLFAGRQTPVLAATDHFEDYVLCTGTVTAKMKSTARFNAGSQAYHHHHEFIPFDGVWLLDYRAGSLMGSVIDRASGKMLGWARVDLLPEFGIQPQQPVHFMMSTGSVSQEQSALYLAETTTGQIGVYTMAPNPNDPSGIMIQRHDRGRFRSPAR
jgi:hypothetical protein